jgi:hypothetical protein
MSGGLGSFLDGFACRISGHIWLQQTEVDGVMMCTRCGATLGQARTRGRRRRQSAPAESIIPENRPWLEPPFMASQFDQ